MKLIALIITLFILTISLLTTIVPGSSQYGQKNPVAKIGEEFAKPLSQVEDIGPEITNALERSGVKLPSLGGAKPAKATSKHALQDYNDAVFSNLDLPRTNFASSVISGARFDGALLDGASLEGASGDNVNFKGARMAKANLNASLLSNSDFSGAELREAKARAGQFNETKFVDSDLSFSSFSGASLFKADFRAAYAAGASLVGADAREAHFDGADLTGVRFVDARLDKASFSGANLKAVDFTRAQLYGTDLSGAVNLTTEQLAKTCADSATKFPEGIVAPRC